MSHVANAVYMLIVWLTSVMIGWAEAGIPSLPNTYGREFFLPYIDYSPWLLTIEVMPTFFQGPNVTVAISDHTSGKKREYVVQKGGHLTMNYTDIINEYDVTEFSGTHISSTEEVSVYAMIDKGDMMTVFPLDALDYEYFIPQRSSPLDFSLVYIFTASNDTTVVTSCNLTGDPSLNRSIDEQTAYPIGAFETLKLETSNRNTIRMRGNKPIGVILVTVDVLLDTENASFEDSKLVYLEFVQPVSTWGKQFYAVSFFQQGSLTFTISAESDTNITLRTGDSVVNAVLGANSTDHFLCANVSTVTIEASRPVQVYVLQASYSSHLATCLSSYFLPPLEQYLRCSTSSECDQLCPAFLPQSFAQYTPSEVLSYNMFFSDANSPTNCTVNTYSKLAEGKLIVKLVEVGQSYMVFLQKGATGSVIPMGWRLARLYGWCVQTIVANGGEGDGVDNDCDGEIDEEVLDMKDDDGDSRVDEDTRRVCGEGDSSRSSRSQEVHKSVGEVFFSGVDYQEEASQKPLIAVIVSLCVSIFAVFAVISIFMLLELISRRNQLRNTKIRPFVS